MNKKVFRLFICFFCFSFSLIGCKKVSEMSLEEIEQTRIKNENELILKTLSKSWKNQKFVNGIVGGVWNDTIMSDPKTFNKYIGERDGESSALIEKTLIWLCDYDFVEKKWVGEAADFEIETDEEKGTLTVHWTIKDDVFWSFYNSDKKIPVTSDDFVFWYNEIYGDPDFHSSGYAQQFVTLDDGTEGHVDCIKIDERRFDFVFPRIVAEPLLACNMSLCPSFVYRPAKERGGIDEVMKLYSVDCDVTSIPSCGKFFISEYVPGQRVVLSRNKDYWEKDENGVSIPYFEKLVCQIVGDANTDFLLFKEGKTETFYPRPEELNDVVNNQENDYTVFNSDGALGCSFWSFNQNPKNKNEVYYKWFTQKKFRQAMSCVLNRNRIIKQVYRGLAQPKYDFFPVGNAFHSDEISLEYRYDLEKAAKLLSEIGFEKDRGGILRDGEGNAVEFDLTVVSSRTTLNDIALILMDDLSKIGIKLNIRQTDFQKVVEMLTASYDWQTVFISLGTNLFPSQGSNVWPSYGNMHLWNPLQTEPATQWEARIDYLYNEGCYTRDEKKAKEIWDEYQSILLEQCPVIYLVRSRSFFAIRNKWNLENVYFDNIVGSRTERVFLK